MGRHGPSLRTASVVRLPAASYAVLKFPARAEAWELAAVLRKARKFGIVLDPDERIRLVRARKGADHVVARVHELAVKYNVDLPGIPLQGMQDDLALVRMLRPVHSALKDVLTVIDDTEGQAESESWDAFLAYYATLSGMATRIPTLAAELKDVQTFMRTWRARKAVAAPVAEPARPVEPVKPAEPTKKND